MTLLQFAADELKVPLTFTQLEMLTLLEANPNSCVLSVKPRSHGMMVIHEIVKKYRERKVS